jgi:hypothetical protein
MNLFRNAAVFSMLAFGSVALLSAQQNGQGDVPRPSPGQGSPDTQQEHGPKSGTSSSGSTSVGGDSAAQGNAGNAASNPSGSGKKPKKDHNVQGHGPQKQHPNGQS